MEKRFEETIANNDPTQMQGSVHMDNAGSIVVGGSSRFYPMMQDSQIEEVPEAEIQGFNYLLEAANMN